MRFYGTGELIALVCAIGWLSSGAQAAGRFNLFDPILADDDSDAHTVSAGSSSTPDSNRRIVEIQNKDVTVISRLPPLIGDDGDTLFASTGRTTVSAPGTSVTSLPGSRIESAIARSTASTNSNSKRHLSQEDYLTASSARPKKQTERPEHWSALDSYYETLKRANSQPVNPYYMVVPYLDEQKLDHGLQPEGKMRPIYTGKPEVPSLLQSLNDYGPTKSNPAWLLPTASYQPNYSGGSGFAQQQQQSKELNEGGVRLPERPIFVPRPQLTSDQSFGGVKDGASFQDVYQKTIDSSYTNAPVGRFWPTNSQPRYPIQQLPSHYPAQVSDMREALYPESLQAQDILHTAQLKNKERSWDEIFDPRLDRSRLQEQLELESYCGPRNRIDNLDMTYQFDDSTKILSAARINELLTSAKPGAFPSHMGLYNGSSPSDGAFLCGATWVHERFALTLASCIPSKSQTTNKDPMLTIRAGEWKAFQSKTRPTTGPDQRPLPSSSFTRRIKRVHIFWRYQMNSSEHNLALVEWSEPTYFMSNYTFISPACPLRTRLALPTSGSCWAPVRNITFSEYFDAEGEGETKLRRNVGMKQVPIKLLNDDTDCKRETSIELFNFQHPNYICSADIKRSQWRASNNQTDSFGSGIFCYDGAQLTLVSIIHPVQLESPSQFGYMDLTYYMPWVQGVIASSRATI